VDNLRVEPDHAHPMTTPQLHPDADVTRTARVVLTFEVGELLCDRFRVTRFIARGGMGELYEAEDLELGERVALKTIRPEIALDDRAHQRFLREVQLARKITHSNICRRRVGDGTSRRCGALSRMATPRARSRSMKKDSASRGTSASRI
jgi:hypothetical protein